jgi:hypothetical protein
VIVGYTKPAGARSHFGAILIGGYRERKRLMSLATTPLASSFPSGALAAAARQLGPTESVIVQRV